MILARFAFCPAAYMSCPCHVELILTEKETQVVKEAVSDLPNIHCVSATVVASITELATANFLLWFCLGGCGDVCFSQSAEIRQGQKQRAPPVREGCLGWRLGIWDRIQIRHTKGTGTLVLG